MAFRPLFEALYGYFRRVGDDAHPELARLRRTLSPVVPAWAAHGRNFTASPPELGEALLQLLMGVGGGRGVVLVLDHCPSRPSSTARIMAPSSEPSAARRPRLQSAFRAPLWTGDIERFGRPSATP